MTITVLPRNLQIAGGFNNGAILEKRPLIPGASAATQPYSNIFYWAYAWSDAGGLIDLHPHRGFEILSFVLRGGIEHYDTAHKTWKPLEAGGMQIIRAGSGISHAERMLPGAAIFQIWLDPDLRRTLSIPASYQDVAPADVATDTQLGFTRLQYLGGQAALQHLTPDVRIARWELPVGDVTVATTPGEILSCFLISGSITLNDQAMAAEDFATVREANAVTLSALQPSTLFVISSPAQVPYATQASHYAVVNT